MVSIRKEKYAKEKQVIFDLFESAYHKIKKGESKEADQLYPTLELLKKIGWGINLAKDLTPAELMGYSKRTRTFQSSVFQSVKRKLRIKYPDLIIINRIPIGLGLRGYKICVSLLEHREEINKRIKRAVTDLQEADHVRHHGSQKFPELKAEYPQPIAPAVRRMLPESAEEEPKAKKVKVKVR